MTKYYVMPKNAIGERVVLDVQPCNMTGVITIDLPGKSHYYKVAGRDKEYPDYKVALAVAMGQIKIDDVTAA